MSLSQLLLWIIIAVILYYVFNIGLTFLFLIIVVIAAYYVVKNIT